MNQGVDRMGKETELYGGIGKLIATGLVAPYPRLDNLPADYRRTLGTWAEERSRVYQVQRKQAGLLWPREIEGSTPT